MRLGRKATTAVLDPGLGGIARAHALDMAIAGRRCGLLHALAADQDGLQSWIAGNRTQVSGAGGAWRTRHLAAPLLGTPNPRCSEYAAAHGLHPFQPGQARLGEEPHRLAAFQLRPSRRPRRIPSRLGRYAYLSRRMPVTLETTSAERHTAESATRVSPYTSRSTKRRSRR